MIKNFIFILAIVLSITNCTNTEKEEKYPDAINSIEYKCENGEKLSISYFSTQKDTLTIQIVVEGIRYDLKRVHSASGDTYSNGKQTWWSKGSSGFFQVDDVITIRNCNSQAKR